MGDTLGPQTKPNSANAGAMDAGKQKNWATQYRCLVRQSIPSKARPNRRKAPAVTGDMTVRKEETCRPGGRRSNNRSIAKSRLNRCSIRVSNAARLTMAAAALAASFPLDLDGRFSSSRNIHREKPASTKQAAAFGAIGVPAPQVRRAAMSSVHPTRTDNPTIIEKMAAAAENRLNRLTMSGSERGIIAARS